MPRRPSLRGVARHRSGRAAAGGAGGAWRQGPLLAGGFIVGAIFCIALFQGVAAGIKWLARRASARPQRFSPEPAAGADQPAPAGRAHLQRRAVARPRPDRAGRHRARRGQSARRGAGDDARDRAVVFLHRHPGGPDRRLRQAGRADIPGVSDLQRVPMLRGRITAFNDVPAAEVKNDGEMRWVLEGDRGITWSATVPPGSRIVKGEWWPADYHGPPLISLDARGGRRLRPQDRRHHHRQRAGPRVHRQPSPISASSNWSSLTINFVMVFSPGILEGAPQTHLATARIADDRGDRPAEGRGPTASPTSRRSESRTRWRR